MAELECPRVMSKLINFLSSLLERVAESNDLNSHLHTQKISVFHGLTRPTISIESYLDRILKYANCSPCCFIVAYIYLDRFTQRQPALPINSLNVHRLLITSVMVAAKFMDDMYYNNAYYAKVGGISTTEMNFLEVDFLFGLGFHLNVTPSTFYTYCSYLQREMLMQPSPSVGEGLPTSVGFPDASKKKMLFITRKNHHPHCTQENHQKRCSTCVSTKMNHHPINSNNNSN